MMSFFLMTLFLIPLIMDWWIFVVSLMMISFLFIFMNYPTSYHSLVTSIFSMDILSYSLICLSYWVLFLSILASYGIYKNKMNNKEFLLLSVFLMIFLYLTFSVDNLFLFYLFFEASLIPTLFLIFGWGYQPERMVAGFYLLFYTLFASLPLLLSLFYLYSNYFTLIYWLIPKFNWNLFLYLSLVMAFLFKMPMLFFHYWLPKAHVEAPVAGSMILAAILLKLGGYGLFRIMKLIPINSINYNIYFIIIGLFSGSLVGLMCLFQSDIKSLIAYSSVAHMGGVICGIFTYNYYGMLGAFIMMLGHGLCSSSLFCMSNFLYERTKSRSLYINKGVLIYIPVFSLMWFLLCANNMSSPPSLNLLGEIYIINGVMGWNSSTFIYLSFSSFLSCCYSIYLFSVIHHGEMFKGSTPLSNLFIREYLLVFMHWIPLNLLILSFSCYSMFI
uniref:NADH dehydrogenase subunit 4 n=1 Tax=Bannacoris arboreus TaxID=1837149 RepID=UPI002410F21A|nr:NADH dehydrogenase subunit 4 [Bannacoris arboreus]WEM32385.1 NADH dehydrogenase subunit 4 [Bannacoris arboreus]